MNEDNFMKLMLKTMLGISKKLKNGAVEVTIKCNPDKQISTSTTVSKPEYTYEDKKRIKLKRDRTKRVMAACNERGVVIDFKTRTRLLFAED